LQSFNKRTGCENMKNFCLYTFVFCLFSPLLPFHPFFLTITSLIANSIPSASNPHSLYNSSWVPCSTK